MKIQVQCYAGYRGEQEPRSSAPVRLRIPWCGLDSSEFISTARSAARRINHHWRTRALPALTRQGLPPVELARASLSPSFLDAHRMQPSDANRSGRVTTISKFEFR